MRGLSLLVVFMVGITASAQTSTAVSSALTWLNGQQRGNGTWGTAAEFTPRDTSRVIVAETLSKSTGPNVQTAVAWLAGQNSLDANQFIAEQALALSIAKVNNAGALTRLVGQRSGNAPDYGGYAEYNGNSYDSALAIQALATNEQAWTAAISGALTTLLVRENADGGWGLDQGFDSNTYVTSEVLLALSSLKIQQPPAAVIAAAQTYLTRLMKPDGSIGNGVLETAVAYRALALSGYSLSSSAAATMQYLVSQQRADGSWGGDAYLTARVLEAIAANKTNLTIKAGGFTLTPSSVPDGATVKATVVVSNIGAAASTSATVTIYASETKSRVLGSTTVGAINAGATATATVNFTATNMTGRQTVVASVDTGNTVDEMREDDNDATASLVVDGKPDLQLFGTDIITSPARLQPGQPATLTVTIRNYGDGDATNVGYAVYDSLNGTESLLKKDFIASIPSGTAGAVSLPITFAAGTHTVRAVADPDAAIAETNETNNTGTRSIVVAPISRVDLRIADGNVTANPARPTPGQAITITALVENTGTDPLQSVVVFYDGLPGSGGVPIAVLPVTIDSQSSQQVQANYTTTASSRVIYAVADPDNLLLEIDETNNSAFAALTDQFADLSIARDGIVLPKTTISAGQQVTGRVVIHNDGTLGATGVQVVLYDDLPQNGGVKVADKIVDVPAQGKAVISATWTARAGQRFATAIVNPSKTIFEVDYDNNRATKPYNANGNEGDIALYQTRTTAIDATHLTVNATELTVMGIVNVQVSIGASKNFTVSIFEDTDGDGAFNPEVDTTVGSTLVQAGLNPQEVQIAVEGSVRFAVPKLYIYLDSTNVVNETNEGNNFIDLWQDCSTTSDTNNPAVKWSNTAKAVQFSPVARVFDTNGDDVVDTNDVPFIVQASGSAIVLLRGTDGHVMWVQNFGFSGRQIAPVVADVDNDGKPEILVHDDPHRLVALNAANGSRKWTSVDLDRDPKWDAYGGFSYSGAPLVADLDNDGKPEVVIGRTCLNGADGSVRWIGTGGSGRAWDTSSDHLYFEGFPDQEAPIAVDLNNDGKLEVVAGNTAYRFDGSILWQRSDLSDGYTAPVFFSGQTNPKICLVGQGKVWLLNSDGTTSWGPVSIPSGAMLGGAPTVFSDGGGGPWIGVAGDGFYTVFNGTTGAVRWTRQTTTDLSFGITTTNSATLFDFGSSPSLVYAARDKLIVYRSSDAAILYSTPITHQMYYPGLPSVADADDDGRADIVVPGTTGLKILSDPTWNGAPAIFNEASYHVVNVSNEMAAIPSRETPTAFSKANYRANQAVAFTTSPISNLTASYMRVDTNAYPASVTLTARVGNNGWLIAPAAKVAFFRLNANNTSTLIGLADAPSLAPGSYGDVSFRMTNPTGGTFTFYARVDDNGSGASAIAECNENDNRSPDVTVRFSADIAVNPALLLVTDNQPRPGDTITFTAIAALSGAIDSNAVTAQFYLGPPSTGQPISSIMTVPVLSVRGSRRAEINFPWTVTASPGPQSVYVVFDVNNAVSEDDENNNTGVYPLQVSTSDPILKLSGALTLTPPSAESGTPVNIDALLQNAGNVPLQNIVINYTVTGGAGTGFTGTATIASLAKYDYVALAFGKFTPSADSTYTVTITPADPNVTLLVSPKTIKVGPFAGAQMTATPARVPTSLPLVQCHTTINRQNTIVVPDDPIVPLIRSHIQSGLNWQAPVLNAAMNDNCFKCHVQAQGLVAFEASLQQVSGVTVDTTVEQRMYTQTVTSQNSDGHFGTSGFPRTTTILGAWELSYWHDPEQVKPYLLKALNAGLAYQNADGTFSCDHCDISYGNTEAMTMMAMIEYARGYELTKDARYLAALNKSVTWALGYDHTTSRTRGAEFAARVSIGLSSALPEITDPGLAASIKSKISNISAFLASLQNPDGSYGTLTSPDFAVTRTAQVLYSLALAGVPGTDPGLRAAILWLINAQQTNGGWKEFNSETNQVQWLDESTWAMIALPAAFARLGQFDVNLQIFLPTATDFVSSNIPPNATSPVAGGRQLQWKFKDVTETGYDLLFNVKLNGIANDEQRPATGAASLSYNDPYSGAPITHGIAVPVVTGFAPLGLSIATDKPVYPASSAVTITETVANLGTTTTGITNDLTIKDANGATVATVIANDPVAGLPPQPFPGWRYAMPVSAVVPADGSSRQIAMSIDFAQKLSGIGVTGTFDRNSIRVSADSSPSQELNFAFLPSDSTGLRGVLLARVPDGVAAGSTFLCHVFFDIAENGFKPASMYDLTTTGGNGLVGRYWFLDTTRTNPNASTPAGLVYSGGPVITMNQLTTNITAPAPPRNEFWASEWTGALYIPSAGNYQFLIGSDDGSWLYIDDQIVLQVPGLHGTIETSTSKSLTAGFHTLKYVIFNWCCGYSGYVKWAPPGTSLNYITSQSLFDSVPGGNATVGPATVLSNGSNVLTYVWNTGSTAAGPYSAVGTLKQFGAFVASAATPFAISPGAQLSGTIATDKPAYDVAETVHVNASVLYNSGNTTLSNLSAQLSIVDPAGTVMATGTTAIASILPGQSIPLRLDWPSGISPAGTYGATLVVTDEQATRLVDKRVPFDLRPTSQSGKGITGTISTPASVNQGETLTISAGVTNGGNSAITNAPFEVRLVDPLTNTLVATIPFTATANPSATYSTQLPYNTISLKVQTYQAYLVSMITGVPVPLANTTFAVNAPPLKLEISTGGPARVLIWSNCADGNSTKGCTPVVPAFLTKTLTDAHIPWTLVGDQYTFMDDMRTGAYSEAILYEPGAFEAKIAAEYLETIRNGFGLLYIKNNTDADPKLFPALGVKYKGNINASSTTLDVVATPFTTPGQLSFNGNTVDVELQGALLAATTTATRAPAIAYTTFGTGRVITIPFDSELTPTSPVANVLLSCVTYLARVPTTDARQVVPIDLKVTPPPGAPSNLTIAVQLPAGMTAVFAQPALSTSTPDPAWNVSSDGSEFHLYLWVRLPDSIGSYTVTATAAFTGQIPIVTKTLTLQVTADRAAMESALAADLTALAAAAPATDQSAIASAVTELNAIRAATPTDAASIAAVIDHVLNLISYLQPVSISTSSARNDADRILMYWQSRMSA